MAIHEIDMTTFEDLRQMTGADFIGELVDTFLDDAPKLIDQLRSALKAGDAETFRRVAHSLKSNGATFGASRLSEQAKALEHLAKENRLGEMGSRLDELEGTFGKVASELIGLRA